MGEKEKQRNQLLEYTNKRLEEIGMKQCPVSSFFSNDDLEEARKIYKNCDILDMVYIFAIGFANGIEYERTKNQHS